MGQHHLVQMAGSGRSRSPCQWWSLWYTA